MKNVIEKVNVRMDHYLGDAISLFLIFIAIALIPFFILKGIESWFQDPVFFVSGIVGCFVVLLMVLIWILSPDFFDSKILAKKFSTSVFVPFMIIFSAGWLTITFFGAVTSALCDASIIRFDPIPEKHFFSGVSDFYLWHALELFPGLKINDTFHVEVPFKYEQNQKGVALMLLIFKIIIAWIILAQFFNWNKWRKQRKLSSV